MLSPRYDEKHHGLYVEKLEQAVRNPKVRNIALTGGYGTGKSSVIQGLIERIHSSKELKKTRPITISLPKIQIADESDSENDRTDQIQREIVKQLLYQGNLRKMRNSRSRKIANITVFKETAICFSIAGILTFVFLVLGQTRLALALVSGRKFMGLLAACHGSNCLMDSNALYLAIDL